MWDLRVEERDLKLKIACLILHDKLHSCAIFLHSCATFKYTFYPNTPKDLKHPTRTSMEEDEVSIHTSNVPSRLIVGGVTARAIKYGISTLCICKVTNTVVNSYV